MSSLFQSMHHHHHHQDHQQDTEQQQSKVTTVGEENSTKNDKNIPQFSMLSPPLSPYPAKLSSSSANNNSNAGNGRSISLDDEDFNNYTTRQPPTQATSPENSPAILNSTLAQVPTTITRSSAITHHNNNHNHHNDVATDNNKLVNLTTSTSTSTDLTSAQQKNLQPASPSSLNQKYKIHKFDPKNPMVSNAWTCLKQDPVGYHKRELAYLTLYPRNGPTWSNYVRLGGNNTVQRPKTRQNRIKQKRFNLPDDAIPVPDPMTTRSASRNHHNYNYSSATPVTSRQSTPKPKPRTTNSAANSASKVHDAELDNLPDYCPSADTLPSNKALKADWKGQPMDLSDDPDAHLLHPAEIQLASVLRLPCSLYLDSKKRLFAEKVHRLRNGLPFRRTDSQKACRIDVNKASRLFSAFERVGWLDDDLFEQYLR